jgi:effector-binding domain-containing protein
VTLAYDIKVRVISAVPALVVRTRVTRDQIRDALADALTAAWIHAEANGVTPSGPPFTRYTSLEDGTVSLEAGVQLSRAVPGGHGIIATELPGGEVATTIHMGPYGRLWAAYEALTYWMENAGRKAAGEPWEYYLTDPRDEPDSSKWRTEVVWPLLPGVGKNEPLSFK